MKITKKFQTYCHKTTSLTIAALTLPNAAFASSIANAGLSNAATVDWPWTRFLNALATELTGPLPMALGIMGIAGAAIAMFAGNRGGGTEKFIMLIFAVSICLFAPNFMNIISTSGAGLTIGG